MKVISFRDLIDLEPKPKKVKFESKIYDLDSNNNYIDFENIVYLEGHIEFNEMKEPNIQIIENKPRIEKIDANIPDQRYTCESSWSPKENIIVKKINELCDIINDIEAKK